MFMVYPHPVVRVYCIILCTLIAWMACYHKRIVLRCMLFQQWEGLQWKWGWLALASSYRKAFSIAVTKKQHCHCCLLCAIRKCPCNQWVTSFCDVYWDSSLLWAVRSCRFSSETLHWVHALHTYISRNRNWDKHIQIRRHRPHTFFSFTKFFILRVLFLCQFVWC